MAEDREIDEGNRHEVKTEPVVLEYARPITGAGLVTLTRIGGMEAELLCGKLRGEGVPCFIADANAAVANPLVFSNVAVQVQECDLERAREIMERPAEIQEDDEYAEEAFRCPKCHRRTVELVPVSSGWRRLTMTFWVVLALPALSWLVDEETWKSVSEWMGRALLVWMGAVLAMGYAILFRKREKRCATCGHVWGTGKEPQMHAAVRRSEGKETRPDERLDVK